jgi:hypothetical protein
MLVVASVLLSSTAAAADPARVPPQTRVLTEPHLRRALDAADYILSLQKPRGAILDHRGAGVANTDSHMQYALIGLAAAYRITRLPRFLEGMRKGLAWLAARQRPNGSWWIAYAATPPFRPQRRIYGISATIGLFAYDLWLYRAVGGDERFVRRHLDTVRRGMSFLLRRMQGPHGTFYSGVSRRVHGDRRSTYRYTSDQADLYLGFRAAGNLLGRHRYYAQARRLRVALLGRGFFLRNGQRYARGVFAEGRRDRRMNVLTVWPQGYVPWVLGTARRTRAALKWLRTKARADGSVRAWRGDPVYTLSAEDLVLGTIGVAGSARDGPARGAKAWMARVAFNPETGGLIDSLRKPLEFCNIAGLAVLAWLDQRPPIPP